MMLPSCQNLLNPRGVANAHGVNSTTNVWISITKKLTKLKEMANEIDLLDISGVLDFRPIEPSTYS